jgi:WD40 repeat protein
MINDPASPPITGSYEPEAKTVAPTPQAVATPHALPRTIGDYELLDEIARGGMGVVWKARQISLNRIVALKMIIAGTLASPEAVQRFRTEAEAAANLDHPNIVPIYEVGDHEGQPYFSMKLIEGGSLSQALSTTCHETKASVVLLVKVARAVHHAHQRGILHRDLKPGNILLDAAGEPHVTDFGLAKRVEGESHLTHTGAIVGTPSYMAPEQARAEKGLSVAVDVYSLGAILYEMLTGRPPFQASTPLDTILQVLEKEPARPQSINPKVDRDLATIALKCLEKNPARRYGAAEALAEELERWLDGEPILARPAGQIERARRWCRRNPLVVGMMAAIFGGAVLATGFALAAIRQGRNAHENWNRAQQAAFEADKALAIAKIEKSLAERREYDAHINLAQQAWRDGEIGRMLQYLGMHAPKDGATEDVRGFEWYYLNHLCHQDLRTITAHAGNARSTALSQDGQRLATVGSDATVKLWDVATGQLRQTLRGHAGWVNAVAFSPDGQRLASAGQDLTVRVWDLAKGELLLTYTGHAGNRGPGYQDAVAFSSDGERIASACDGPVIKVWNAATGANICSLQHDRFDPVIHLAFSADGKWLASASYNSVKLWDAATGQMIRALPGGQATVAFSSDSQFVATGGLDCTMKLWSLATGQELRSCPGQGRSTMSVAVSPDGKRLATGGPLVKLWDTATGKELLTLRGHTRGISGVLFSKDGRQVISSSWDGSIKFWDAERGCPEYRFVGRRHTAQWWSLAFSPDSRRLVAAHTHKAQWWDADSGEELPLPTPAGVVRQVALSPDGRLMAGEGQLQDVVVWDATTGATLQVCRGHQHTINKICFSANGELLASASEDQTVKLWQVATGQLLHSLAGHQQGASAAAFSPNGRYVATGSRAGVLTIWSVATAQQVHILPAHDSWLSGLAFSPDGKRLASASYDSTLKIWDADNGKVLMHLLGHSGSVTGVAFHSNSQLLASCAQDATVKVWDAVTGQELLSLRDSNDNAALNAVTFSADGKHLAAASNNGTILIWDALPN